MKSTLVGVALAGAFIAAIFAVSWLRPHPPKQPPPQHAASTIEAGFVGAQRIGAWTLVCLASPVIAGEQQKNPPLPLSLSPSAEAPRQSASPEKKSVPLGRCRVTLQYGRKDQPRHIVLAVNFRFVGADQKLALIVRMPPNAKKGDSLGLRIGTAAIKVPVAGCGKSACIAMGALDPAVQSRLLVAGKAEIVLPPAGSAKRSAFSLPLKGLTDAISAMRRAEAA